MVIFKKRRLFSDDTKEKGNFNWNAKKGVSNAPSLSASSKTQAKKSKPGVSSYLQPTKVLMLEKGFRDGQKKEKKCGVETKKQSPRLSKKGRQAPADNCKRNTCLLPYNQKRGKEVFPGVKGGGKRRVDEGENQTCIFERKSFGGWRTGATKKNVLFLE